MSQTINLTTYMTTIDAGNVSLNLSGWLGGFDDQSDATSVSVVFLNYAYAQLGNQTKIGPVTAGDRNASSSFLFHQLSVPVPRSTRYIIAKVLMIRGDTGDNDANADNLAIKLNIIDITV
jgi:hypothetical protein